MILCDSNVWLALALSKHSHHSITRDWLETIEEPASVLLCRATQQTFLRLLTNASVLSPYGNSPLTNRAAYALAGRYRMVTTDAAFRQFRGLDLLVLGQQGD